MRGRFTVLLATAGALASIACDPPTPPEPPATRGATATAGPRRIALLAIPLTAEVPPTWDVRRGPGGALVLSGRTPSGDRDIAMAAGPRVAAFELPATQPATPETPGGPVTVRVDERDGMRVVERIERVGAIDQPADVAPVRWQVRFILPAAGLDLPSYELDVLGLTQLTFERDEATLRAILDTVRPAAAAAP